MTFKQVTKYKRKNIPARVENISALSKTEVTEENIPVENNNTKKKEKAMDERVNKAEEIMNNMKAANHVKVVKKDKGLIERTESSKIVLTEDNRQVLND
jgi:hypothetical protein